MKYPPCFDSLEQYKGWMEANSLVKSDSETRSNYCNDCLPEYQARMVNEARCNYPHVKFIKIGIKAYFGTRTRRKDV